MKSLSSPQAPARASARLATGLTGRRAFALASPEGSNHCQSASVTGVRND